MHHHTAGTPLALPDILSSTLFHQDHSTRRYLDNLTSTENIVAHTKASLDSIESRVQGAYTQNPQLLVPVIAPAEHNITGRPGWELHPCHTSESVQEMLDATGMTQSEWDEGSTIGNVPRDDKQVEASVRWMRAWFTLVGSLVVLH